jgi:hypothetical protein
MPRFNHANLSVFAIIKLRAAKNMPGRPNRLERLLPFVEIVLDGCVIDFA